MRTTSILRIVSAAALICSMSSFSGCEKDNVSPSGGCQNKKTTTPTTPTTTTPPTTTSSSSSGGAG
ncbi:hypothetical protein Q5H92_00325 [Hymenobacter sp. M29]|uniref:Uncharacterized protein n=1 Tax=Hymenobacter mellowenesis TaxID=3063995 RepID=A0ABT9A4M4_9BACT|nr:hypothetical protein [Hymenobacter sp. M29]MDO7844784.1 hypothetical protein [Hymenobacter sp. M29]